MSNRKTYRAHLTNAQVREEYRWFRERERRRSDHDDERDYGISSDSMVAYAMGEIGLRSLAYPNDLSDLLACYRCVTRAPQHLRGRMTEALHVFGPRVLDYAESNATRAESWVEKVKQDPKATARQRYDAKSGAHYYRCKAIKIAKLIELGLRGFKTWLKTAELPPAPKPPVKVRKARRAIDTIELAPEEWWRLRRMALDHRIREVENIAYFRALKDGQEPGEIRGLHCDACDGKALFANERACAACGGYGRVARRVDIRPPPRHVPPPAELLQLIDRGIAERRLREGFSGGRIEVTHA